jgi:hypothetical protein
MRRLSTGICVSAAQGTDKGIYVFCVVNVAAAEHIEASKQRGENGNKCFTAHQ